MALAASVGLAWPSLSCCSQLTEAYDFLQRLVRDFKRLQKDPPQGINGSPNPENIMHWNAVIFGPEDTPWDGGLFRHGYL